MESVLISVVFLIGLLQPCYGKWTELQHYILKRKRERDTESDERGKHIKREIDRYIEKESEGDRYTEKEKEGEREREREIKPERE